MSFIQFVRRLFVSATPLLLVAAAACGLLDTNQPNIVGAEDLDTPAGAATKRLGAISIFTLAKDGDFNPVAVPGNEDAFNDDSDGYILTSGILADEFVNPGFIPSRTEVDLRLAQPTTAGLGQLFQSLARARNSAEDAAVSLATFGTDPATDTGIPEMLSLAGFTYVFFAEGFCSGVPVSRIVADQIEYGQPLTTAQLLDTAIVRFNTALAHPSIVAGDPIHSLASVGLARALVNKGLENLPAAAAAVASVLPEFVYETEHATTPAALHNGVFEAFNNGNFGVYDQEGGNGLNYVSAEDIRVQGDSGIGADNNTETWFPSKYPSFESSIPLADYLEAQLIIAESELQAGAFPAMTQRLNDLRAGVGLGGLATPGDATSATDLLFAERAFWLFATGHRLGDMRRLIRQYLRDPETVFPTGEWYKGGLTYGTDVNLPLPRREQNNPNVPDTPSGCLDRNA
jgi:starch-binding outer membrane protein, SusD/RagB family